MGLMRADTSPAPPPPAVERACRTPRTLPTLEACRDLDRRDPLAALADRFARSASGRIHFDANSMGAMPVDVPERIRRLLTECWRDKSRRAWTSEGWVEQPRRLGADVSHLIGAGPGDVVVCDNTTINLFKAIAHAWKLRAGGDVILTESHNFPTDLHVAQGFVRLLNDLGVEARVRTADTRERLLDGLDRDVAILYLSHTDYRSSERWDLAEMNEHARAAGALTVWDLSHSAGALDVDLAGAGADFAVGCGYKYLCGGPGGPAFLYVDPAHQGGAWPAIAGWMGHAKWDRFLPEYAPDPGTARHLTGTPPVIANEVFAAAAGIWREVRREDVARKHESLTETLIALLDEECGALGVGIESPRHYPHRGGHVSFSHPGAGPVSEALVDHGLLCSFRAPSSIRLAMSPLYHRHEDVWRAVRIIRDVLAREAWRDAKYQVVSI